MKFKFKSLVILFALALFSTVLFVKTINITAQDTEVPQVTITNDEQTNDLLIQASAFDAQTSDYSFWIMQQTEDGSAWMLLQRGANDTLSIDANQKSSYQVDGYYNVYVIGLVEDERQEVYQFEKASDIDPFVSSVTINGDSIEEYNYFYINANVVFSVGLENTQKASVIINGERTEYDDITNNEIVFSHIVQQGSYTVQIIAGDSVAVVNIFGMDNRYNYSYIENITFDGSLDIGRDVLKAKTSNVSVKVNNVGSVSHNYQLMLLSANTSTVFVDYTDSGSSRTYTAEVDFGGSSNAYGIYTFKVVVMRNNIIEDCFDSYYNYSRDDTQKINDIVVTQTSSDETKDIYTYSITVQADNIISGAEYQLLKYAYNNTVLILSNDTGNFNLTLNSKGVYQIEVRIKQDGAGSYELYKLKNIVIGDIVSNDGEIEITPILDDDDTVLARRPYLITAKNLDSNQQVKFIVSSYGKWQIKEKYSPNNQFVWIPEKEGVYEIYAYTLTGGRTAYFDYIVGSGTIEVLTRKPAEQGEIESFSDVYSLAAVSKSSTFTREWLNEYADTNGTVANGVVKLGFNVEWGSLYIKPRQEKNEYLNNDSLIIRMLIIDPDNALSWFRIADGGTGQYQVNDIVRGKWHNYIVPASVFVNNYDAFNAENHVGGRIVLYNPQPSKSFYIYIDTVYLVKRTPVEANEVENFSDILSESSIRNQAIAGLTWLDSFNGEDGVIKVDYAPAGPDWPALRFIPRQSKAVYTGYSKIVFRMYIDDPDEVLTYFRLTQDWDVGHVIEGDAIKRGQWHDYEIDAWAFVKHYDEFLQAWSANGMLLLYTATGGNFSIYIDSITMV